MLPVVFCLVVAADDCFAAGGCFSVAVDLAVGVLTITLRPLCSGAVASVALLTVAFRVEACAVGVSALGGTATRVPVTICFCVSVADGFVAVVAVARASRFAGSAFAVGLSVETIATVRATTVFLGAADGGAVTALTAFRGARGL